MSKKNHYYPSKLIAHAFSDSSQKASTTSKINAINIVELLGLIDVYKFKGLPDNSDLFLNFCLEKIENRKRIFVKVSPEDILTNLIVQDDDLNNKNFLTIEDSFINHFKNNDFFKPSVYTDNLLGILHNSDKQQIFNFLNSTLIRAPKIKDLNIEEKPLIPLNYSFLTIVSHSTNFILSDLIPVINLQLGNYFIQLNEVFGFTDYELELLKKFPIWLLPLNDSHVLLAIPHNINLFNCFINNGNSINNLFINKIIKVYENLVLLISYKYIIYKTKDRKFLEYIIKYYYATHNEYLNFRERLEFPTFKENLHISSENYVDKLFIELEKKEKESGHTHVPNDEKKLKKLLEDLRKKRENEKI